MNFACSRCGKGFTRPPSRVFSERVYCSVRCRNAPRVAVSCDSCGKRFERAEYLVAPGRKHYCSMRCCGRGHATKSVERICSGCGVRFFRHPRDEVPGQQRHFHSVECYRKSGGGFHRSWNDREKKRATEEWG